MASRSRWAVAALAGAVAGAVALTAPTSAHVSVNPAEAQQGGFVRVAFRVPTESDTLSTTKVEIHLPADAPVASVSTMPVAGWTVAVQRRTLDKPIDANGAQLTEVVSVLTWTAQGDAAIKPGQFQEFPVSLGPLPAVDKMVFKALQTYSDGTVVRWIEEPGADGKEPEHPAPVLKLVAASPPGGTGGTAVTNPTASRQDDDSGSGLTRWLAVAGLVAGLGGLALGGLAYASVRRRRA